MATPAVGDTVTLKSGCCHMMTVECMLTASTGVGDGCCPNSTELECVMDVRCVWCDNGRTKRGNFASATLQVWVQAP